MRLLQGLSFLFLAAFANAKLASEYDHAAYLDPEENYKLYWSVKDVDNSIHFAVEVNTTGWVGFGISAGLSGSMKGADIVIGWVDSQGKGHLQVRRVVFSKIFCPWAPFPVPFVGGPLQTIAPNASFYFPLKEVKRLYGQGKKGNKPRLHFM